MNSSIEGGNPENCKTYRINTYFCSVIIHCCFLMGSIIKIQ